jgi:hypothetical protein
MMGTSYHLIGLVLVPSVVHIEFLTLQIATHNISKAV